MFDALKSELIQYLRETKTFKDADVAASNINTLVGLYSYIGSLFGYYINSVANEVFLPSAKRYKNLNRIARLLAYNPRGDKAAQLNVIGSLNSEYCLGKEDTYFEIPAYSIFPSLKTTPDGVDFVFTNPILYPYSIRSFGVRHVEQSDFTYAGLQLPVTKTGEFWGYTASTTGSSGSPATFRASDLILNCSDTQPLSILDRLNPNKYRGYDTTNAPLFDPQDSTSIGQPFTRNITTDDPPFTIEEGTIYYVVWNYNSDIGSPYLTLLEEGVKLNERQDDIITGVRLEREDSTSDVFTLREVQNNAKQKFYIGVLGLKGLESVTFEYDIIDGTTNSVNQIHMEVNQSGDQPPLQVLIDGVTYIFRSGRISSQTFNRNNWDINVTAYNVNLVINSPNDPDLNYNATLRVTTDAPGVNEVTIANIYPQYQDL
jgi:hypothetical protein